MKPVAHRRGQEVEFQPSRPTSLSTADPRSHFVRTCAIIAAEARDDRFRPAVVEESPFRAVPMPARTRQTDRMGALPSRSSFFLNPYPRERFTRCSRCNTKTRLREIPLVVHVDSRGLLLLRKTCRLCTVCEMLIAHEAEVARVIERIVAHPANPPTHRVLGTLGSATHREELLEDWNLDGSTSR